VEDLERRVLCFLQSGPGVEEALAGGGGGRGEGEEVDYVVDSTGRWGKGVTVAGKLAGTGLGSVRHSFGGWWLG
jgi:hypothetical protein